MMSGFLAAAAGGHVASVTQVVMTSGQEAVETALGLVGIMALWMGLTRIAEEAGLVDAMARALMPLVRGLFPSVPEGHPALRFMMLNLAANVIGAGGAATPMGLKAMEALQTLNPDPKVASPAMCTFLALNTTCITLVPTTVVALRALSGSRAPAEIVVPTILATAFSTVVAIGTDATIRRRHGS